MGPSLIGASAVQLNVFINSNLASALGDKPISWLNYAFRLMQFPLGVFGVAVMTATLPSLSRKLATKDFDGFGSTLTQAIELVLLLTLPAAVGLAVLGEPIMRLIYEHGRFTSVDTQATALALSAYAFGLPGYSALKIVQPAFVAMDDAKTPMYVGLGAVAVNALVNFLFVKVFQFGHVGLAASTALMATGNVAFLVWLLERRRPTLARRRLAGQLGRIAVASGVMGGVGWGLYGALQGQGFATGSWGACIELLVAIPLCVATYFTVARGLGVVTLNDATAMVARKFSRRRAPA
jgi:putative peptidoglycan lipid II flippase